MMTFRVVRKPTNNHVRCPYRVIEQTTGREIEWINQYLDYETLRRLADATLRTYAHELLHFLRWWESVHHTDEVTKDALTESTLLDYVRFQSSQERELTGATINQRVAMDWAPILRQPVKAQFSLNGEKSYAFVSKDVHKGIQGSRRQAGGTGGLDRRGGARV